MPRIADDPRKLRRIMRTNRWVLWFARHWLVLVVGFFFLYTALSLVPPVLMETGHEGAADVLYTIYSPMCHQFAFRSWFFFGDQLAYPRAVSGTELGTFEAYAASSPHFADLNLSTWSADLQLKARSFKGNEAMGYKTALCQRDVAIYGMMFLTGLLFSRVRHWLRPVPIWLYILVGIIPVALDGGSQMLSYPPFELWPVRETLPGYRALTGALFGMMNVWLAFPYLEESMNETSDVIAAKIDQIEDLLAETERIE